VSINLYNTTCFNTSKLVTCSYSTSFSYALKLLNVEMRIAIYNIYGFVRFADEIADTFVEYDRNHLINKFEADYNDAVAQGISSNPIINSFLITVKKYNIADELIRAFFRSMKSDLSSIYFTEKSEMDHYIYGSADVIGLMCLKVFTKGNENLYEDLKHPAMKLGSALQKVNFIRDLKNDMEGLGRKYFPEINKNSFSETDKEKIIKDIKSDFCISLAGIRKLPHEAKWATLTIYYYYYALLKKIDNTPPLKLINTRIRIDNLHKAALILKSFIYVKFKMV